ncbi:MAG TPA: MFS transporter [Gaiellaceae bacterium]|nr:MFS transporter [Gaiellaceae bacterium]
MKPGNRRLLALLTVVIALDYADRASVGALAPDLKDAFSIGNTGIGLLASAFSLVSALGTLPAGLLVDRLRRTLLLATAIGLWTLAMGATGAALSFGMLLGARIFLGVVTAVARPAIASMVGDTFSLAQRSRALSVVDSGDLVGTGVALLAGAVFASLFGWRGVFWLLGACGLALGVAIRRLDEPRRRRPCEDEGEADPEEQAVVQAAAEEAEPDERLILEEDPVRMPLHGAVEYVLRIRTYLIVIASTALGSFFFAGVKTFGVVFGVHAYGLSRSQANLAMLAVGAGGLVGLLVGGRLGDTLVRRGHVNGRLLVATASYVGGALALAPAILVDSVWIAMPFLVVGGAALVAPSAPLDAVRLDLVHPRLWGRAEGVRNVVQIAAEAGAPLLFGYLSDTIGLRETFLLTLGALVVAALLLLVARRFYPPEVLAAAESR